MNQKYHELQLQFFEVQELAKQLSTQNTNLQKIAVKQDQILKQNDKQIVQMNEYMVDLKEVH